MTIFAGCVVGFIVWFLLRYLAGGLYTVDQNERAVKTIFGRADRVADLTTLNDPISESLREVNATATSIPSSTSSRPAGLTSSGRGNAFTKSPSPRRR